ncbi:MAG TPA: polysaccharide deacetylase family protein [Pirellulales bacterium]
MNPLPELPLLLADVPAALRQALAQEGVPAVALRGGRAGKFVLFDSLRGRPALAEGQVAIDVRPPRAESDCDPLAALADEQSACHEWRIGGLAVRETVARVPRALARRRLLAFVRGQVEAAGGLWLRVSPYPRPYRGAFNFRLDHDDYDREDFHATLAAIAGHEHAVSHYVCAATHVEHPEALRRLRDHHVGSHGWRHHTYRDTADNLLNIGRGIDALRAAGIEPVGFVAPHGRFNAGLLAALEELGVTHSSEFSLAYDDLPFFPRESDVLQLPVHPICLGVCLEAARRTTGRASVFVGRPAGPSRTPDGPAARPTLALSQSLTEAVRSDSAADILLAHWRDIATQKHAAGQPMFFYGHPDGRLGRHPRVLRELLAHVSRFDGVWQTTLAGFEQWWRERAAIDVTVARGDDGIEITAHALPAAHRARLDYFRGNQATQIDLDRPRQTVRAAALRWRSLPQPPTGEISPVVKSPGWRAELRRYLDWERVTPVDEISARTWRGWAKKTLRQVKA